MLHYNDCNVVYIQLGLLNLTQCAKCVYLTCILLAVPFAQLLMRNCVVVCCEFSRDDQFRHFHTILMSDWIQRRTTHTWIPKMLQLLCLLTTATCRVTHLSVHMVACLYFCFTVFHHKYYSDGVTFIVVNNVTKNDSKYFCSTQGTILPSSNSRNSLCIYWFELHVD